MSSLIVFFKKNWLLMLILIMAFAIRVYNLDSRNLGTDENYSLKFSKDVYSGNLEAVLNKEPHPPGYYFLVGLFFKIYDSVYFVRVIHILIGLFGVTAIYFFVSQLLNDKALAILSAFLLALNPMHVLYSTQIRSYILLSLICLLSSLALYNFIFKNNKKIIYLLIPLYIWGFYTHFYSVFIISSHFLAVLYFKFIKRFNFNFKTYIKGFVFLVLTVLLYVPRFFKQFDTTLVQQGGSPLPPLRLIEIPYPFYKYALMVNIDPIKENFPFLFALGILLTLLFFYGIYKFYKKDKNAAIFSFIMFFGVVMIPLLLDLFVKYVSSGRTTIYYFRFLSFLVPFYVFFVAYGVSFKNKWLKYVFVALITVGWLILINYYYDVSASYILWNKFIGM